MVVWPPQSLNLVSSLQALYKKLIINEINKSITCLPNYTFVKVCQSSRLISNHFFFISIHILYISKLVLCHAKLKTDRYQTNNNLLVYYYIHYFWSWMILRQLSCICLREALVTYSGAIFTEIFKFFSLNLDFIRGISKIKNAGNSIHQKCWKVDIWLELHLLYL